MKVHFWVKMNFQWGLEVGESAKTAENELSPSRCALEMRRRDVPSRFEPRKPYSLFGTE